MNPVLSLRNVSKGYFGHAKVLEGINLQLARGDFLYVVGGSGAGKSSFLRMLATEELPSSGHVSLFGYDLGRMSPSVLQTIRRTIAVIPQDVRLIPDLTVEENVALSLELSIKRPTQAEIRRRVSELLGQLGLSSKRMSLARDISGGEAQRVAVARAVIRQPDLLIADEPTGSQDRDNTWGLMELFVRENRRGCAVVLATHDLDIVRKVKKPCAVLRDGKLVFEENPWSC